MKSLCGLNNNLSVFENAAGQPEAVIELIAHFVEPDYDLGDDGKLVKGAKPETIRFKVTIRGLNALIDILGDYLGDARSLEKRTRIKKPKAKPAAPGSVTPDPTPPASDVQEGE